MKRKRIAYNLTPYQGESGKHGIGRVTWDVFVGLLHALDDSWEIVGILSSNLDLQRGLEIKQRVKEIRGSCKVVLFDAEGFLTYFDIISRQEKDFLLYELALESFISQLEPTHYFEPSLFEWDHPTSLGKLNFNYTSILLLYDLIPYIFKDHYLQNDVIKSWYFHKLSEVKNADYFFSISNSTAQDFVEYLRINPERIFTIHLDASPIFRKLPEQEKFLFRSTLVKYSINKRYVLYVPSGYDYRKNFERLIESFGKLPHQLRKDFQLVITSQFSEDIKNRLYQISKDVGLTENDLVFTGYVPDEDLVILYNLADLFVYPSLYEGFGLPVLEAMRCGCPVIGSNTSGLREIIVEDEAMFDPYSVEEMTHKMFKALTEENFKRFLMENSEEQQKRFSWSKSIESIVQVLEQAQRKVCET